MAPDILSFIWPVLTTDTFCAGNEDKMASWQIHVRIWEGFRSISKWLKYNGWGTVATKYYLNIQFNIKLLLSVTWAGFEQGFQWCIQIDIAFRIALRADALDMSAFNAEKWPPQNLCLYLSRTTGGLPGHEFCYLPIYTLCLMKYAQRAIVPCFTGTASSIVVN